ncbi:unnamed protein product, partial [marine sediment metagenome]
VPFSELVDWMVGLAPERLTPPSFGEEEKYHIVTSPSTASNPVGDTKDVDAYDLRLLSSMPVPSASTAKTAKEMVGNVA